MKQAVIALRLTIRAARQSRGRVCAGARMRRPALQADSPAVLGLMARRETRYAHYRSLRSNNRDESEDVARSSARPRALRSSAPHMSLPSHTRPRLCQHHRALRRTPRAPQRGGRCPGRAICGAARSAAPGSTRAARFVRLTRRDCPSATNEVSETSFATRHRREHRSGVGAKRRPPHHEPAPGTVRRAAHPHCTKAQQTTSAERR